MSGERATRFDGDPSRFNRIEKGRLREIVSNPLWYQDPILQPLIIEYFVSHHDENDEAWKREKNDFTCLVAGLLAEGAVYLGTQRGEGYNDDDRAIFKDGQVSWVKRPNCVVVHHTNTPPDIPYRVLNALHLMRLYVRLYIEKNPYFYGTDADPLPIESGHFFEGEGLPRHQTFVGYHDLVRLDGNIVHILRPEYMGFHAGVLAVNRVGLGVAIVGELGDRWPTDLALHGVAKAIRERVESGILREDFMLIGHREVQRPDGSYVDTVCPGDRFMEWKNELMRLIRG